MIASRAASAFLKRFSILLLMIGPVPAPTFAQTQLGDVHIAPRPVIARSSPGTGGLTSGLQVIKKDVNLVLVPVSVVDPMQRYVVGLHPENFQVFEGKKAQEIRHFSSEDAPVSVGLILDASGSMRDKIEPVREAVREFCRTSNVDDEFFMITFSAAPRLANDFTRQPAEIEKELLYTLPKGRTALLDAIYMGLEKMKQANYPRKALLIISDGGDNHSRFSERDIQAAARESDVEVYSIGIFDRFMPTEEEMQGPALLSEIAEPTGGQAFTITSATEMPEVARRIGMQLRTQYVLGYHPQDVPLNGKWHKINVKLRLPKSLAFLRVHFKSGYYAQTQ